VLSVPVRPEAEKTFGACSVYPVGVGFGGSGPPLPKIFNYFRYLSIKTFGYHLAKVSLGVILGNTSVCLDVAG